MNNSSEKSVTANPLIVLREEFDDWAILFDPDTGHTFCVNPIAVVIWKNLDGQHSLDEIAEKIREAALDIPSDSDVTAHVQDFIRNAIQFGLASYDVQQG
jgi:SynChlorMet cassette protein ScmD